jgi:hypothetical protein
MLNLVIRYESVNEYEQPVHEALFDFLIKPCNDEYQAVQEYATHNSLGVEPHHYLNTFGFEVERIRGAASFRELHFFSEAKVHRSPNPFPEASLLSVAEEREMLADPGFRIDLFPFLNPTHFTQVADKEHLPCWVSGQSLLEYYLELNQSLSRVMEFAPAETTVETTAHQALELGKGVCQDFTHVFIGWCRKQGLPARYISGYLSQGFGFAGDLQMHAWPEVWLPGHGWLGFDPANNHVVDEHYVKVAHGADYADCSPLRGVIRTAGAHQTQHKVNVTAMEQHQQQQQ